MKINMRTILSHLLDATIKEWQAKVPDKKLEEYDNWKTDLIDKIDYRLSKQNITLEEIILDNTEIKEETK